MTVTPRFRPCGNPDCRICAFNEPGKLPDSGHPDPDRRAEAFLVGAILVPILFLILYVVTR